MSKNILTLLITLLLVLSPVPASAAGLTSAQVQAILSLLSSFGADSSVIANVSLALTGSPTPTPIPTPSSCSFTRDLTIGSSGADVSCLQKTLSDKGYTLAFGVTGFFGVQTQAAVIAWQQAVGISPASGYFGSLSRSTITGTATTPTPSLKLSSLSPVSGPIGTTVTISGSGFTSSNNTLYVNNILAGAQINSSGSSLTFVIPAQLQGTCASYERLCLINNTVSSGSQAISIRNANGTSNSLTFTVVPPLLSSPVVCAADVSVCPDGSIVGRTGSACTFACGVTTANKDPGTGLWMPPGTKNLYVVTDPVHNVVQLPGAIGLTAAQISGTGPGEWPLMDFFRDTKTGALVDLTPGKTLALRYRTAKLQTGTLVQGFPAGTVMGFFRLYDSHGATFPFHATISASLTPGDFSDSSCAITDDPSPMIYIASAKPTSPLPLKSLCIIPPDTNYYLNIRINNAPGTITSRIKGADGYYVWTDLASGDCTRGEIFCPTYELVPGQNVREWFVPIP